MAYRRGGTPAYKRKPTELEFLNTPGGSGWDPLRQHGQGTINASPATPQPPCNLGRSHPFGTQPLNLRCLDPCCRSSSLVFPFGLSLGNALALPLKHQLSLEPGDCPKHVEHQPAGAIGGVDSLLEHSEGDALLL